MSVFFLNSEAKIIHYNMLHYNHQYSHLASRRYFTIHTWHISCQKFDGFTCTFIEITCWKLFYKIVMYVCSCIWFLLGDIWSCVRLLQKKTWILLKDYDSIGCILLLKNGCKSIGRISLPVYVWIIHMCISVNLFFVHINAISYIFFWEPIKFYEYMKW